jgi:type IV pilus assembly protein PilB
MEPRVAELLVRGGVVSRDQLNKAQEKGRDSGSSVMKELVQLGFTTEQTLTEFLAKQFGIEKIELVPEEIEESVFTLVPPQLTQKHQLVPTKLTGSILTVAMADPTDLIAINEIKFITGYGVRVVIASPSAIKKTLDHRFGGVSYDDVLKKFGDSDMELILEQDDVNLQELQQATMEAPVVTLVNAILADAAKRRASDIHIEPYEKLFR